MALENLHRDKWEKVVLKDVLIYCDETERDPVKRANAKYVSVEHIQSDDFRIRSWADTEMPTFFRKFARNDVLIALRRVYLRKVAIADFEGICSPHIYVFKAQPEQLLQEFLPFVFQNDSFFAFAIRNSAGSISPYVYWKTIQHFQFHLPPLDEQRRIADLLYKIEAAITQTEQQAQAMLVYRKGLINRIFNLPDDVGTVLPKIQKTVVLFGKVVANLNENERNPLEKGMTRFIGLEHLEPEHLRITNWSNIADGTTFTKVFRQGQVLFGKRRAYLKKAAMTDFDGICSGDILVFEAQADKLLPGLLPYLVQNEVFFQHAVTTSAGSISPRTKWKDVANFEFYLPDMDRQQKLLDIFTQLEQALEHTKRHAAALTAFKKGLLNELIG